MSRIVVSIPKQFPYYIVEMEENKHWSETYSWRCFGHAELRKARSAALMCVMQSKISLNKVSIILAASPRIQIKIFGKDVNVVDALGEECRYYVKSKQIRGHETAIVFVSNYSGNEDDDDSYDVLPYDLNSILYGSICPEDIICYEE